MKKRILWESEFAGLATGFSVISREILTRLHKTGKYEIAELARYVDHSNPAIYSLPWKVYPAMPHPQDQLANQRYRSSNLGQFGEAVFENVCLDFQPDIVLSISDQWMDEHIYRSALKDYFKTIWLLTIDGEPQKLSWIENYAQVDRILTYSEYGSKTLERDSGGTLKSFGLARPGVNHEIFRPMDGSSIRKSFGIPEDAYIIGTIMRNQKRKLFPDLLDMFKDYIHYCVSKGNEKLARNTYLYLHTSFPDVGYDISRLIMESGLGHRIYLTYSCEACGAFYPSFFKSEVAICNRCKQLACTLTNTQKGITRDQVATITNLFDVYIQYSVCEGLGMGVTEAKACGIPAMGVDYTATSEQVRSPGCYPLNVGRFFYESMMETEQRRALPDNEDAVKKLYSFFCKDKAERKQMGELARKDAVENYSFDRAAKVFEGAIDSIEILDRSKTWDDPTPKFVNINTKFPQNTSNEDLVDWSLENVLGKPHLKTSKWRNDLVNYLDIGYMQDKSNKTTLHKFTRQHFAEMMVNMAQGINHWESIRYSKFAPQQGLQWELV